jgi:hypothetical protein
MPMHYQERNEPMKKVFLVLCALALVVSCKQPADLSVQTILFAPDGNGYIQFYTNDTANLGLGWLDNYPSTAPSLATAPWTVSVTMQKNSGAIGYGVGCIFCYADFSNFYRVLISWNGGYRVDKKVAGNTQPSRTGRTQRPSTQDWGRRTL